MPGAGLVEATYDVSKSVYNGEDVQSAVVKRYEIQLTVWSLRSHFSDENIKALGNSEIQLIFIPCEEVKRYWMNPVSEIHTS